MPNALGQVSILETSLIHNQELGMDYFLTSPRQNPKLAVFLTLAVGFLFQQKPVSLWFFEGGLK